MGFGKSTDVRVVGGPVTFYSDYTTTNLYVELSFSAKINTVTVTNDSETDTIQVSWDGATLHGDLKPGESMTFNVSTKRSVYVKGTAGGGNVRLWGW